MLSIRWRITQSKRRFFDDKSSVCWEVSATDLCASIKASKPITVDIEARRINRKTLLLNNLHILVY
ncbi:MAG: hypothetical protein HC939_14190 [Pleurocapsa sp. SU_5_0]|nr:hypothetical protein [Pleurocapsa sp. SU_5_0]